MRIVRSTALGVAALGIAAAGVLSTTGTAVAGQNGQQIHFKDTRKKVASIWIYGSNQNGQNVGLCWQTPTADTYVRGHWWKGVVDVKLFGNRHCDEAGRGLITILHPNIRRVNDDSDWQTVRY
ncbi:hypothetical protein [Streptomyces cinnamoneus]|uniref:Uncharacterized protein n=1 Tax=Streptomyces cinnamoneus TaxID=53446 RepID=A0A918WPQ8_STRCJ|nr:hypothetical protein [Streptomyces cinnamoneus]GHC70463.1 hypothetical protein GCM10010507_56600 [Streptomyces cinnamoneus]